MNPLYEWYATFQQTMPIVRVTLIALFLFLLSSTLLGFIRKIMLKKTGKKKHAVSSIKLFTRAINYFIFVVIIISAFISIAGSWQGLGVMIGLLSAALGFALQRPITGIAAWIMIIFKRPFEIGDRVIIGDKKGDVKDITLAHVYLEEIGGTIESEENSGRTVIIPNHYLFEYSIINYTLQNDYVLDEVVTTVTYESDLDLACKIILKVTRRLTKDFRKVMGMDPYVRTFFRDSGIDIYVRYYTPARERQKVASEITQSLFRDIKKTKRVEIAYPHTEIVFKDKKIFKKKR